MTSRIMRLVRFMAWALVFWCLFCVINCYTLAWFERCRHRRGTVAILPGYVNHYGLQLELVTIHYTPHIDSWWGWRRHIEVNA